MRSKMRMVALIFLPLSIMSTKAPTLRISLCPPTTHNAAMACHMSPYAFCSLFSSQKMSLGGGERGKRRGYLGSIGVALHVSALQACSDGWYLFQGTSEGADYSEFPLALQKLSQQKDDFRGQCHGNVPVSPPVDSLRHNSAYYRGSGVLAVGPEGTSRHLE